MTSAHLGPPPSPRQEFIRGMGDIFPLVVGAIPFGLIFGTLAASSGLSGVGAIALSLFVFAGSAQFIALGLLAAGTALPWLIMTVVVVNLRHLLYSFSLMPHVRHLPPRWQIPLSFGLTDEVFAVAIRRYTQADVAPAKHWHLLGAEALMYGNWVLCTALGVTLGQQLPNAAALGLDFAMVVTFIGMVVPYLTTRPMGVAVVVAAVVAMAAHPLPHQLGLLVACLAGIVAGAWLDSRSPSPGESPRHG